MLVSLLPHSCRSGASRARVLLFPAGTVTDRSLVLQRECDSSLSDCVTEWLLELLYNRIEKSLDSRQWPAPFEGPEEIPKIIRKSYQVPSEALRESPHIILSLHDKHYIVPFQALTSYPISSSSSLSSSLTSYTCAFSSLTSVASSR